MRAVGGLEKFVIDFHERKRKNEIEREREKKLMSKRKNQKF